MSFHSGEASSGTEATQGGGFSTPVQAGVPVQLISCLSCRQRKSKCDRVRPRCGTCSKLHLECEYPQRKRSTVPKRRKMQNLEARLAQLETHLEVDGDADVAHMHSDPRPSVQMDSFYDPSSSRAAPNANDPHVPSNDAPRELIDLGMQERLPSDEMMNELHHIYFEKFHPTLPFIHRYRYFTSLDRAPHARPPVSLQYAIWAVAATLSDTYRRFEDLLYVRARFYAEAAEMKGVGESFVSVYHAQSWILIAMFEAKKTYFSRSWMSAGKAVRLVQMLGLYRIDAKVEEVKEILPPPRDWIEVEERRRTFWAAFYGDRWASSMTGWPMLIGENEILTNLPASEESFVQGVMERTISLAEALTSEGSGEISVWGGVLVSITLYGQVHQHLHTTGPNEHPEDLQSGEFWKRHRRMDSVLSNTFMFLPNHLKLPGGAGDMKVVFTHMNIHASAIGLHQAALAIAAKHNITTDVVRHSQLRSQIAAEEITQIMRRVDHVDGSNLSSWTGHCLYIAAVAFLKERSPGEPHRHNATKIDFLLSSMRTIGKRHPITKHFAAQLQLDMGNGESDRRSENSSGRATTPGTISAMADHHDPENIRSFNSMEGGEQGSHNDGVADNALKDILVRARAVPGGVSCNAVTFEETETSGARSSGSPIAMRDRPSVWASGRPGPVYPSNQSSSDIPAELTFDHSITNLSVFQNYTPGTFTTQASKAPGPSRTLPTSNESTAWDAMLYPHRTADMEQSRSFDADDLL